MCLPLVAVMAIATVASTMMSMAGQARAAEAKAASDNYNAQVADNNAKIARQNEKWSAQAGQERVSEEQMKTKQAVGAITAQQAASGVDVNSGSAVEVRSGASETGQLNAITLRSNAARQAYGFLTEESGYKSQAELDRSSASNTEAALPLQLGSTFLGGVSSAASNYSSMSKGSSII